MNIEKLFHWKGIKRAVCLFLVNKVFAGTKHFDIKRKLLRSIGYIIGNDTKIVAPIECYADLQIGNNCWIGKNLTINGNGKVIIGDNCDLAPEITFVTGGHAIGNAVRRAGTGESYEILVGSGVWIGCRSTICKSVSIGNGCVVAACSCVVKSAEDNLLIGGVPAKTIKKL